MRIALLNRDKDAHIGGDAVQVLGYKKALEKMGHQADYMSMLGPNLKGYDEAWLFHLNFGWTRHHWQAARQWHVPFNVFPIFYPLIRSDTSTDVMKGILWEAKGIYCLSHAEAQEMIMELELPYEVTTKIHVIPNGVDRDIFQNVYHNPREIVMASGRYEEYKGQHRVAAAANNLGLSFLTVGSIWDKEVFKTCEELSRENVDHPSFVFDAVPQDSLKDMYNRAKVYVCASTSERNNLSILEAAACGASVINSKHNRGNEWLSAPIIDPVDNLALEQAIYEAYNNPKDYSKEVLSWDEVVRKILV